MIRYRLDDLGWYQFEWLVQALLKEHLGVGVESWGGRGDHGRDAWSVGPLHFPAKDTKTDGPFLFQMKFVENANAAGAKPIPRLVAAVRTEASRISRRERGQASHPNCKHYILLTNCAISPDDRDAVNSEIVDVLPNATTHCLGGNDLCDLLDVNPTLRRSFPQLLSLRDLDVLLADVVNRDILERSSAAISYARDIATVFVPTAPYVEAYEVLKKHHFVVLEGPPEMGKSAIGWMIALGQIASGWEATVCDTPDDFFRALRSDASQIFIADDAFGRTEYDPSRGVQWEAQLHRVFSRLGNTHWLVWTSRKHILERARKHMDLQGGAQRFPEPGEVLVDASQLTIQDKALMLYRHAKHTLVSRHLKDFIQQHATEIVHHDAFTPERIRRFVLEAVPQLIIDPSNESAPAVLSAKIDAEIQNPTDRMRKSFHALPLPHKWMLLSLLECGHYPTTEGVLSTYDAQYGDTRKESSEILDELTEAFVSVKGTTQRYVGWIHPSYRDLVIEQLRDGGSLKSEFLNRINIAGIKLALSDVGDSTGKARFRLLSSPDDWEALHRRALEVAQHAGVAHCADLLTVVVAAIDGSLGQERSELQTILKSACSAVRERWDSGQVELSASAVAAYAVASERTSPMEPMPTLDATWKSAVGSLEQQINDNDFDFLLEYSVLDEFLFLVKEIEKSEPRFIRRQGFPDSLEGIFDTLLSRIDRELESDRWYSNEKDGYDSEADASFGLAASLGRLAGAAPNIDEAAKQRITSLTENANRCRSKYQELEAEEAEPDGDFNMREVRHSQSNEPFDINSFFADL
jgi:hypothetical protein